MKSSVEVDGMVDGPCDPFIRLPVASLRGTSEAAAQSQVPHLLLEQSTKESTERLAYLSLERPMVGVADHQKEDRGTAGTVELEHTVVVEGRAL
jgi:hypothetical protein